VDRAKACAVACWASWASNRPYLCLYARSGSLGLSKGAAGDNHVERLLRASKSGKPVEANEVALCDGTRFLITYRIARLTALDMTWKNGLLPGAGPRSDPERNDRSSRRCTLSYSVPSRSGVGSIRFCRYDHSGTSRLDYSDAHCGRWGFRHLEF
jgi:hypothetical protein